MYRCVEIKKPSPPYGEENKLRNPVPVLPVGIAKTAFQVSFFKMNPNENIDGHPDCEQQVASSHARCGPKSDEDPRHHGVAHELVEQRCLEPGRKVLPASQIQVHLLEAKQLEVIDKISGNQHDQPPRQEQRVQDRTSNLVFNLSDYTGHGSPLPKQEGE